MLDSNKTTNFNKKSHFKAFVYVSYDTIQFIWYAHYIVRFMNTYYTPIRYETFYTRYDTYCMILTTMVVALQITSILKQKQPYSSSSFSIFHVKKRKNTSSKWMLHFEMKRGLEPKRKKEKKNLCLEIEDASLRNETNSSWFVNCLSSKIMIYKLVVK